MEVNKIYNENCIEGIKRISDRSVKAIICDPPYFQGLTHNGQKGSFLDLNISAYFFKELFQEFQRILMDDGCVYFFCDWRGYAFYYPLLSEATGCDNMLVWDKGSGAGNFYTNEHELIIFHSNNRRFRCRGARNVIREIPGFASGAKKEDGEKKHPTQKPTALIRKLIEDSTEPGDLVADFFAGSGTTGVAAKQTGRKFILFEISEKYCQIAERRIQEAK